MLDKVVNSWLNEPDDFGRKLRSLLFTDHPYFDELKLVGNQFPTEIGRFSWMIFNSFLVVKAMCGQGWSFEHHSSKNCIMHRIKTARIRVFNSTLN